MATVILPFTAVDGDGNVRANARLFFYQTGTTTLQNTFADASLSAVNTNPVVADSNGMFHAIYLGDPPTFTAYKMILKTSADVTVETTDPIAGSPITTPISASLLRGYLSGIQRTGSTGTTFAQGAGVAADDTNTTMLSLISGTINAATVGADGLDAGSLTAPRRSTPLPSARRTAPRRVFYRLLRPHRRCRAATPTSAALPASRRPYRPR